MADIRYKVTKFGTGFNGPGSPWLGAALNRLRKKLKSIDGPFTINQRPKTFTRYEVLKEAKRKMSEGPIGKKLVIHGQYGDQPSFSIKKVDATPPESPLITYGAQWVGKSSYLLGGAGPPGPSDCSGFTRKCVLEKYNKDLPHSANLQMHDDRIKKFHDSGDLQSGDFVFFNYGRLAGGVADHVEFWVSPGKHLGSRPSTHGINYYYSQSYDADNILCYGRLVGT